MHKVENLYFNKTNKKYEKSLSAFLLPPAFFGRHSLGGSRLHVGITQCIGAMGHDYQSTSLVPVFWILGLTLVSSSISKSLILACAFTIPTLPL